MKPAGQREQLIAEFEKTNEELRALKLKAQRIRAELCELKNGSKIESKPSLSKPATSPKKSASKPQSSKPRLAG